MNGNTSSQPGRFPRRGLCAALALALVLPACAPDADERAADDVDFGEPVAEAPEGEAPATDERPMIEGEPAVRLAVEQSETFGEYIALDDGTPVYMFTADEAGVSSSCYDACADAWPPVIGSAAVGSNLDARLVGTIARDDGSNQATYDGWPLYTFARDTGTEPTGQDMQGFGGEWYLVSPSGGHVQTESGADQ